jgi:hypothetical protein
MSEGEMGIDIKGGKKGGRKREGGREKGSGKKD